MRSFTSTIEAEALGHIFNQLSTLYAQPEKSVLREYITNGIDSHIASGVTRSVKVTLPTVHSPKLVVRDFGNGLNDVDFQKVFFSYGSSTKRNTNDQVGSLGLGAKSAFSLAETWTVTSIHGGLRWTVVSTKNAEGVPTQRIVADGVPVELDSDDPDSTADGITVTIPMSRDRMNFDWIEAARDLATWMPKGSVEFDGLPVKHWSDQTDQYTSIGRVILHSGYTGYQRQNLRALMGGVVYNIGQAASDKITGAASAALSKEFPALDREVIAPMVSTVSRAIVEVPMGSVTFVPSREDMKDDANNREAVVTGIVESLRPEVRRVSELSKVPVATRLRQTLKTAYLWNISVQRLVTAAGIPNTTNVFPYMGKDVDSAAMTLVGLMPSSSRYNSNTRRVLVTGVPANTPLPNNRIFAKFTSAHLYTTPGADTGNEFLNSLLAAGFSAEPAEFVEAVVTGDTAYKGDAKVFSFEDYKAEAREIARSTRGPRSSSAGLVLTTTYDSGNDPVCASIPLEEVEDHADAIGAEVVLVEEQHVPSFSADRVKHLKMSVVFVHQGRRKTETIFKTIEGVRDLADFNKDVEKRHLSEVRQIVPVEAMEAIRAVHRNPHVSRILPLYDRLVAAHGDLLAGHRIHDYTAVLREGNQWVRKLDTYNTKFGVTASIPGTFVLQTVRNAEAAALGVSDAGASVTDLWPLIPTDHYRNVDDASLEHLAVYLAAVG